MRAVMAGTPIVVPSAIMGNDLIIDPKGDTVVFMTRSPDKQQQATATVNISTLVEKLVFIPGLTVKYTKPVEIPRYLGAVVERERGDGAIERWVRVHEDSAASMPWFSNRSGRLVTNDAIAGILTNGGYEREPQFPTRRP